MTNTEHHTCQGCVSWESGTGSAGNRDRPSAEVSVCLQGLADSTKKAHKQNLYHVVGNITHNLRCHRFSVSSGGAGGTAAEQETPAGDHFTQLNWDTFQSDMRQHHWVFLKVKPELFQNKQTLSAALSQHETERAIEETVMVGLNVRSKMYSGSWSRPQSQSDPESAQSQHKNNCLLHLMSGTKPGSGPVDLCVIEVDDICLCDVLRSVTRCRSAGFPQNHHILTG